MPNNPYIGRFAPSPTGPLHLGSLYTAVASYLDARSKGGKWLVRMDDLDPPREQTGAASHILQSLEAYGLEWDGEVLYQSHRDEAYEHALETLWQKSRLFYCTCSRKQLQGSGDIYPGSCRDQTVLPDQACSIRLKVEQQRVNFNDQLQGAQHWQADIEIGDFILKRKDQLYAYQLAVVVDDYFQGISHIVRGIDLMDSTPRQLLVQKALNIEPPTYSHLPVIVNQQGQKLSKQTYAQDILTLNKVQALFWVLTQLQVAPPQPGALSEMLTYAEEHWDLQRLANQKAIYESPSTTTD